MTDNRSLLSATAELAASYVAGSRISIATLPQLIGDLHAALVNVSGPPEAVLPTPALSLRRSVRHDRIFCLDCGKGQKMLKRHLLRVHDLTADAYRKRWGLPGDYPLVSPDYAALRSKMARQSGLGRKPGKP